MFSSAFFLTFGLASRCELNIWFPLPQSICWSPNTQSDGVKRWSVWGVIRFRWGHEDGAPMMVAVPLLEDDRDRRSFLHHVNTQAWKRTLTRTQPCCCHDLRLSANRTMRNNCCLSSFHFVIFCYNSLSRLRYFYLSLPTPPVCWVLHTPAHYIWRPTPLFPVLAMLSVEFKRAAFWHQSLQTRKHLLI